jgi:hypothetical protein
MSPSPCHRRRPPLAVLAACVLAACATTGCATTNPYVAFADAGSTYAARLDAALLATERTGIDATSWRMLDDDLLANATVTSYDALSQLDRDRAVVLRRLRRHGAVLARYFGALSQLSSSAAPSKIAEQAGRAHGAIGTAWNEAQELGDGLRANLAFPPSKVTTETAKIVVAQVVKGVLRKELELRGDLIAREIGTQEALLATIADVVEHDLALGAAVAERILVVDPLVAEAPVRSPEAWVSTRQRILTAEETLEEVRSAKAAARALRETFEALTTGKPASAGATP